VRGTWDKVAVEGFQNAFRLWVDEGWEENGGSPFPKGFLQTFTL
jgi:hypothetical protein